MFLCFLLCGYNPMAQDSWRQNHLSSVTVTWKECSMFVLHICRTKWAYKTSLIRPHTDAKLTLVTWQLDWNSDHQTVLWLQSVLMKSVSSLCKRCRIWQTCSSAVTPEHNKCIGLNSPACCMWGLSAAHSDSRCTLRQNQGRNCREEEIFHFNLA